MTSLLVHTALYMDRQWESQECCIFAILRSLKHIYKSIYIQRWDTGTQLQWRVTNMARNDLRARGGLGGREAPHQLGVGVARSATPTASII